MKPDGFRGVAMKVVKLRAKNYRTLENIDIDFAGSYCAISGKNNAGKSSIIRLLSTLFNPQTNHIPFYSNNRIVYSEDKTQWVTDNEAIEISYHLKLTREDDPALINFIEKIATRELGDNIINVVIKYIIDPNDNLQILISINGEEVSVSAAKEIDKRIKDSNLIFLYNSTSRQEEFFWRSGRIRLFYEIMLSAEEKKKLDEAMQSVEKQARKFAKEHTKGLSEIIGKLSEKYTVELAPLESYTLRQMPLGINLYDKSVKVPLSDWGSGTQNRMQILMAILQAYKIRTSALEDEKITPIVVVEEPESFLHPSAQAEFGKLLRDLASEFKIQLIVTTHSPYMLNYDEGSHNILLDRKLIRRKPKQTIRIDTSGENWMEPFADHLGIPSSEFSSLHAVFKAPKDKILLVEGAIDKEYFEYFQKHKIKDIEQLNNDISIVPYGGKDTLKNTLLLKFVLDNYHKVFITFDLDAESEVSAALKRLGKIKNKDYLPIGQNKAGYESIEGLLPERVLSKVFAANTELVMKLQSKDNRERRSARDKIKKLCLEEFKRNANYTQEELSMFEKTIHIINKAMK